MRKKLARRNKGRLNRFFLLAKRNGMRLEEMLKIQLAANEIKAYRRKAKRNILLDDWDNADFMEGAALVPESFNTGEVVAYRLVNCIADVPVPYRSQWRDLLPWPQDM